MSAKVKTRFLVISDTHGIGLAPEGSSSPFRSPLPKADVAIHCGDLSKAGRLEEYDRTFSVLESIDAEIKLVIAGNHDITLDEQYYTTHKGHVFARIEDASSVKKASEMWRGERAKRSGIMYLEEGTYKFDLKNGAELKVYASQYQPEFYDWAFMYGRHQDRFNPPELVEKNAEAIAVHPIPNYPALDLIVTHGPALGHLDTTYRGDSAGCPHLLKALRRARPKLHCCGHIHEGWGAQKISWGDSTREDTVIEVSAEFDLAAMADVSETGKQPLIDGKETLLVNAAIMNLRYKPDQEPWLVDVDLSSSPAV